MLGPISAHAAEHPKEDPINLESMGFPRRRLIPSISRACPPFIAIASWVAMRTYATILTLLLTVPAYAVDTLQVTTPDPLTEAWRWTEFDRSSGLADRVRNIYEDQDGNIWFATGEGVQRYDGRTWRTYTTEDGLANDVASAIVQTRDGAMWFGTTNGISRFEPAKGEGQAAWTTYTVADGLASNRSWSFRGLYQARDGTLWAGSFSDSTGAPSGISRFDGQTWATVDIPGDFPRLSIASIYQTSDGDLWFWTVGQGVLRFNSAGSAPTAWTRYTTENGLVSNSVIDIMEAGSGSLWFAGGRAGVSHFDESG